MYPGGYGFGRSVGFDGVMIDAACKLVETRTVSPKMRLEIRKIECLQISDRLNPDLFESYLHYFPDPRDATDGEWGKKGGQIRGLDDEKPVRFSPIGGDLREKFIWSNTRRSMER